MEKDTSSSKWIGYCSVTWIATWRISCSNKSIEQSKTKKRRSENGEISSVGSSVIDSFAVELKHQNGKPTWPTNRTRKLPNSSVCYASTTNKKLFFVHFLLISEVIKFYFSGFYFREHFTASSVFASLFRIYFFWFFLSACWLRTIFQL